MIHVYGLGLCLAAMLFFLFAAAKQYKKITGRELPKKYGYLFKISGTALLISALTVTVNSARPYFASALLFFAYISIAALIVFWGYFLYQQRK